MAVLDVDLLRHALSLARQNGYSEVDLEVEGTSFTAVLTPERRSKPRTAGATDSAPVVEEKRTPLKSTLVGYYKESNTPLVAGAKVEVGEVVANITALGISNDVESKVSGTVSEVLVTPGQPVEYGQVLAWVEQA
jgi:acetyl-CoA carboxylase biotin carboxyl carrier protein